MTTTITISASTLKHNLSGFSDMVYGFTKPPEDVSIIKVPYATWKTLNRMIQGAGDVEIVYSSGHSDTMVLRSDVVGEAVFLSVEPGTFGEYLVNEHKLKSGNAKPDILNADEIKVTGYLDMSDITYLDAGVYYNPYISTTIATNYSSFNNNTEEKEDMTTNKFMNFEFGPCTGNNIRMSMYGLAVKNASGTWVSYDAANGSIMDVDILNFDGSKFLYKMPVALNDIRIGDVIIHARKPMYVTQVTDRTMFAVDPVDGEVKEIMPTKSPFGFNFATKVVNFMGGMFNNTATAQNPFGNMWMLMAMGENKDIDPMMLMLMMNQGGMAEMNPMMLALMLGGEGKDTSMRDMLMLSMMMGQNQGHSCKCNHQEDVNPNSRVDSVCLPTPIATKPDKKPVQAETEDKG